MNKETLQEKFESFKKQVEDLRTKLQETGEQFLLEHFKETFDKHQNLKEVRWTQYTPYFNDGEECTFRSNHEWADIIGADGELDYDSKEYKEIKKNIREFLSQFDDELLRNLFGDHVEIVVTKEGINVEKYEHE